MGGSAIRWDSLLVRHVARELHGQLAGRRVHALRFDRERLTVQLRCDGVTLAWDLRADRGDVHVAHTAERLHGNVPLPRPAVVGDVFAPPDERVLTIRFDVGDGERADQAGGLQPTNGHAAIGVARDLTVELIPPAWNAVAVGAGGRVIAALRPRPGGVRPLAAGRTYEPPQPAARAGATTPISADEWRSILGSVPPGQRRRALLAHVAYTSPINGVHILGAATRADADDGDRAPLDEAFARYRGLTSAGAMNPCVLDTPSGAQPYPFLLDGVAAEPQPTLLAAFEAATRARGRAPPDTAAAATRSAGAAAATLDRVKRREQRVEGRIARLRAELEGAAAEATALRRHADLLLTQLGRARRGDRTVTLDDFAGGAVVVTLDPTLSPADNAQRLYDMARKRERAAHRLPSILRQAEAEAVRLSELARRIEAGAAEPAELEPFAPTRARGRQPVEPRLPYRRYRTTGGLEVRVGRSAADSDELTLHLSNPNDIWLHARDVAGAHVVLRWSDREANPPGADLREAAILAAVHSKARSSTTAPVDWTRRKYVRKPRKTKPGRVMIERAKTLFVEPSESLEKRLRESSE